MPPLNQLKCASPMVPVEDVFSAPKPMRMSAAEPAFGESSTRVNVSPETDDHCCSAPRIASWYCPEMDALNEVEASEL